MTKLEIRASLPTEHTLEGFEALFAQPDNQAIAADRASGQVANKAEVEPVAWLIEPTSVARKGMRREVQFDRPMVLKSDFNATPLYATPPVTTGASTVLTDERKGIEEVDLDELPDLMQDWQEAPRGAAAYAVYKKIEELIERYVAREIAAQAGQVAVPAVPTKEMIAAAKHAWAVNNGMAIEEIYAAMLAAAPSPAKESK